MTKRNWLLPTGIGINVAAILTTYPFLGTMFFWLVLAINDSIGFLLIFYWFWINKTDQTVKP